MSLGDTRKCAGNDIHSQSATPKRAKLELPAGQFCFAKSLENTLRLNYDDTHIDFTCDQIVVSAHYQVHFVQRVTGCRVLFPKFK